jgi:hypothetical protein
MKKMVLVVILITMGLVAYAQVNLSKYTPVSGNWAVQDGRLFQNDDKARLAKVNIPVPQKNTVMSYEFDARYEDGGEDGHGGFGLHIFADKDFNGASWGAGQSYLLWLNYDENPQNKNILPGLTAQIYRSYSNSYMVLMESFDLNDYIVDITDEEIYAPVHFKVTADSKTGEIHVYDPVDEGSYYVLNLGSSPLEGSWVVLRTNGVKLSFSDFDING